MHDALMSFSAEWLVLDSQKVITNVVETGNRELSQQLRVLTVPDLFFRTHMKFLKLLVTPVTSNSMP